MIFHPPLVEGILIRRYKRFLADVWLNSEKIVTVHVPNSGSMQSCLAPNWKVLLSLSNSPTRRYSYTLEMVWDGKTWIGVNTLRTNDIIEESFQTQKLKEFSWVTSWKREVKFLQSRFDFFLYGGSRKMILEVKSVTWVNEEGSYLFPDAPTTRGQRQLENLILACQQHYEAALIFVMQRGDGHTFRIAQEVDPIYAQKLQKALQAGVKVLGYRAQVTPTAIVLEPSPLFFLH